MLKTKDLEQKKKFKTALHAAIAYLIGAGIIETDGDVAEEIKVEKGNLSSYKNGKKPYGDSIVVKFEKAYNLNLAEFNPDSYSLEKYIQKKSGAAKLPDQLLTQMHEQIETMKISLLKLADLVPSVQEENLGREVTFDHSPSDKNQ